MWCEDVSKEEVNRWDEAVLLFPYSAPSPLRQSAHRNPRALEMEFSRPDTTPVQFRNENNEDSTARTSQALYVLNADNYRAMARGHLAR